MLLLALLSVFPFVLAFASGEGFVQVSVAPPKKLVVDSDKSGLSTNTSLPRDYKASEESELGSHRRVARKPNTCKFPTVLSDSQLDCKLFPNRVECVQTCMFGHTLGDGIQRVMKCRYDEDRWTPSVEFEKCEPFVDCSVTLGPGGKYKCHTNFMDHGTVCDISCARYEDKVAVPVASYQCQIDGTWAPQLPFCAKPGSGAHLVAAPSGPKLVSTGQNEK